MRFDVIADEGASARVTWHLSRHEHEGAGGGSAAWLIVTAWPATIRVMERAAPALASTEYLTLPLPVSGAPPVIVTHGALPVAVQLHDGPVFTWIASLPPRLSND